MIFESAVFLKWVFVITNRIMSWFGSGYYLKKGYQKKDWRYYLVAALISLLMFGLLMSVLILVFHSVKHFSFPFGRH